MRFPGGMQVRDAAERVLFGGTLEEKLELAPELAPDDAPGKAVVTPEGPGRPSELQIVEKGVRLLGLDYFSIGPYRKTAPTHRAFLKTGDIALETIDLSRVEPGSYELCCLPLKVKGSGGAPARVLLGVRA